MLPILIITVCFIAVLTLLFWQASNIKSILLGAPAISSPNHELWQKLADPSKTIIDLGCGNGSVCLRLSPQFKQVYGIEYSPFYYWVAKLRSRRHKNITIIYGDFIRIDWPPADLIYCYLLPAVLGKIKPKLSEYGRPVLSLAFQIPGWTPMEKFTGQNQTLYLYHP